LGAKRFLIPAVVGVVTFGAVTAFAATLSVSSNKLSAGNTAVATCNAVAQVSYATTYSSSIPGYVVSTATITTASTCSGMAYKVTLSGSGNTSLGEQTGSLDVNGGATTPAFSPSVNAANVTGVSVVITG
jgi:hypothetical protein